MRGAALVTWILLWVPVASIGDVANGNCSNALVTLLEKSLGASSIEGMALKLLGKAQDECTSNECPRVDIATNCKNQSIDDINCEMPSIFSTSVKLGTDDICDAGCDDWPCKAGCKGIDTGICYGADYILCKGGCLGIHSCVHKCEHAIVDPCKDKLINDCSSKCEATFSKCKSSCEKQLTMDINGDFERLQRIVTSMNVSTLDVNCSGNGITDALHFQANAAVRISNAALGLKIHIKDVGVSETETVDLQKIALTLSVPFSGIVDCGLFTHNLTVKVGEASLTDFNLDVDLTLDKTIDTIASVVCADLPFCKDAIHKTISKSIKDELVKEVPPQVTKQLQPVLQKMASELRCPKLSDDTSVVV